MRMTSLTVATSAVLLFALSPFSQARERTPAVVVPQETYCRAETDRTFYNATKLAGGVNRFFHFRTVTPLDNQTVVRMNRDTLYSAAVVDSSKGATITVPKTPDGSYRYTMRFEKGQLPPVNSFWSLTMYDLPASLLVHNPIDRYLLNSTMLTEFKFDDDGGLTLYVQYESPGKEKEANWLPAPKGSFWMVNRLYWPKAEAVDGKWKQPPLMRVK